MESQSETEKDSCSDEESIDFSDESEPESHIEGSSCEEVNQEKAQLASQSAQEDEDEDDEETYTIEDDKDLSCGGNGGQSDKEKMHFEAEPAPNPCPEKPPFTNPQEVSPKEITAVPDADDASLQNICDACPKKENEITESAPDTGTQAMQAPRRLARDPEDLTYMGQRKKTCASKTPAEKAPRSIHAKSCPVFPNSSTGVPGTRLGSGIDAASFLFCMLALPLAFIQAHTAYTWGYWVKDTLGRILSHGTSSFFAAVTFQVLVLCILLGSASQAAASGIGFIGVVEKQGPEERKLAAAAEILNVTAVLPFCIGMCADLCSWTGGLIQARADFLLMLGCEVGYAVFCSVTAVNTYGHLKEKKPATTPWSALFRYFSGARSVIAAAAECLTFRVALNNAYAFCGCGRDAGMAGAFTGWALASV